MFSRDCSTSVFFFVQYYEGLFHKDSRHGRGQYCWPTGHKFIGKFYLNRKEGYGQQVFPDGTTFKVTELMEE